MHKVNEVYVSYNGTLYVPYIDGYVYWDVICSLHERITKILENSTERPGHKVFGSQVRPC